MSYKFVSLIFACVLCCSTQSESRAQQSVWGARDNNEVPASVNGSLRKGTTPSSEVRSVADQWAPADVDEGVPAVRPNATCSLPDVLSGAGQRVEELVDNLQRFRATEVIQHRSVDRSGRMRRAEIAKFDYFVSITTMPSGLPDVEEHRRGYSSSDQFPDHVNTEGVPILVLIFYPPYSKHFDMHCEGLGNWHGEPAWQVHFQESRDGDTPMCGIEIDGHFYPLRLRGRAWILAHSYQVARLETDLEETVPRIRLRLQHEDIEYGPVYFPDNKIEMWLPSTADLYMDFVGHRFYRRHSFTDFQVFSVTTHEVFGDPRTDHLIKK
jgi:hypothetical protein